MTLPSFIKIMFSLIFVFVVFLILIYRYDLIKNSDINTQIEIKIKNTFIRSINGIDINGLPASRKVTSFPADIHHAGMRMYIRTTLNYGDIIDVYYSGQDDRLHKLTCEKIGFVSSAGYLNFIMDVNNIECNYSSSETGNMDD